VSYSAKCSPCHGRMCHVRYSFLIVFLPLRKGSERLSFIGWPSDYRTHVSSLAFARRDLQPHICKEVRRMNKNTSSVIIRCLIFIIMEFDKLFDSCTVNLLHASSCECFNFPSIHPSHLTCDLIKGRICSYWIFLVDSISILVLPAVSN